jgi:hypothetical protein
MPMPMFTPAPKKSVPLAMFRHAVFFFACARQSEFEFNEAHGFPRLKCIESISTPDCFFLQLTAHNFRISKSAQTLTSILLERALIDFNRLIW